MANYYLLQPRIQNQINTTQLEAALQGISNALCPRRPSGLRVHVDVTPEGISSHTAGPESLPTYISQMLSIGLGALGLPPLSMVVSI